MNFLFLLLDKLSQNILKFATSSPFCFVGEALYSDTSFWILLRYEV